MQWWAAYGHKIRRDLKSCIHVFMCTVCPQHDQLYRMPPGFILFLTQLYKYRRRRLINCMVELGRDGQVFILPRH